MRPLLFLSALTPLIFIGPELSAADLKLQYPVRQPSKHVTDVVEPQSQCFTGWWRVYDGWKYGYRPRWGTLCRRG